MIRIICKSIKILNFNKLILQIKSFLYIIYPTKEFKFWMQNQYSLNSVIEFLKKRLTLNIDTCKLFLKLLKNIPKKLVIQSFQLLIQESKQKPESKEFQDVLLKMQKSFKKKVVHFKQSCSNRLEEVQHLQKTYKEKPIKKMYLICQFCNKKIYGGKISKGVHSNKCQKNFKKHQKKNHKNELLTNKKQNAECSRKRIVLIGEEQPDLAQSKVQAHKFQQKKYKLSLDHTESCYDEKQQSIYEESQYNSLLESAEQI